MGTIETREAVVHSPAASKGSPQPRPAAPASAAGTGHRLPPASAAPRSPWRRPCVREWRLLLSHPGAAGDKGVDQTWTSWAGGLQSGPRCVWGVPPSQGAAIIQEKAQHPPGFTMSHANTNVCPAAGQLNVRPAPPGTCCRDSPARSGVGSAQPHFGPGASFKNTHLFSNNKVKFKKRFPSRAHGFGRPLPLASLSMSPWLGASTAQLRRSAALRGP